MPTLRLSVRRALAIIQLCESLLARAGVEHPPVSTDILHRLHPELEVEPTPLAPLASALRIDGDGARATIYVDESQSVVRQRFSIAHEYGHYLLHHLHALGAYGLPTPDLDRAREIEADHFAAQLLIPLSMLEAGLIAEARIWRGGLSQDKRVVLKIASRYNVSPACARKALRQLDTLRGAFRREP